MARLKLQMQLSLDGFISGPEGEMDWMVWDWDDGLKETVSALTASVGTILLGRGLAEGFIPTWAKLNADPETADDSSAFFVNTPKIVFSRSLKEASWDNTLLASGDLKKEVLALKSRSDQDLIAYGGGRFVSALIEADLIDDYYLFINPALLGQGINFFQGKMDQRSLMLKESQPFECGIVMMHYGPAIPQDR